MYASKENSYNSGVDNSTIPSEPSHLSQVEPLAELNERVSNSAYEPGRTKIGLAAQQGNVRQVESIIYEGGSANESDEYGETALHLASGAGQMDMIKFLVEECHCEVNSANWEGWTPLFWATVRGQLDAVKLLVSKGADVEIKAAQDWTVLHYAALNGDIEMVNLLLENGAEPTALNAYGCSAMSLAVNADVATLLDERLMNQTSRGSVVRGYSRDGHLGSRS